MRIDQDLCAAVIKNCPASGTALLLTVNFSVLFIPDFLTFLF